MPFSLPPPVCRPLAAAGFLLTGLGLVLLLAGCTLNTYPDGHRETVLGVPSEEGPTRYSPGVIVDEQGESRAITDAPD
ncbi:hypothetical protein [Halomonas sp. B23F22_10]|uniref:hypothetical protein n=1 Tax=Halomonas sp. B23F22_10 TaxID=3459515 RepID=UPI00373E17BA